MGKCWTHIVALKRSIKYLTWILDSYSTKKSHKNQHEHSRQYFAGHGRTTLKFPDVFSNCPSPWTFSMIFQCMDEILTKVFMLVMRKFLVEYMTLMVTPRIQFTPCAHNWGVRATQHLNSSVIKWFTGTQPMRCEQLSLTQCYLKARWWLTCRCILK